MIPKSGHRFSEKIMRKENMRTVMKTLTTALLLALAITPAVAQPRLKAQVTIASDIVRIGDLVENAGVAANTPVFRAPDLGQTGAVPARAGVDGGRAPGVGGGG